MKKTLVLTLLAACCVAPAMARNEVVKVSLQSVLDMPEAKTKLDGSVKFFLSGAKTPKIEKKFGDGTGHERTNSVGKSPEYACQWAALSALISFEKHAKQQGANAVVDLVSSYGNDTSTSSTEIQCHDGAFVSGVTLKGTYAKVAP